MTSQREAVARKLLGNGASSLPYATKQKVANGCTRNTDRVNAMMFIETSIFSANESINKIIGNFIKRDRKINIYSKIKR
jgi:hypothetical protein